MGWVERGSFVKHINLLLLKISIMQDFHRFFDVMPRDII